MVLSSLVTRNEFGYGHNVKPLRALGIYIAVVFGGRAACSGVSMHRKPVFFHWPARGLDFLDESLRRIDQGCARLRYLAIGQNRMIDGWLALAILALTLAAFTRPPPPLWKTDTTT